VCLWSDTLSPAGLQWCNGVTVAAALPCASLLMCVVRCSSAGMSPAQQQQGPASTGRGTLLVCVLHADTAHMPTISVLLAPALTRMPCPQVLAAHALRPKPDAPKRASWNNLHWWLGRTTLAVGISNVFVGIVLNNKKFGESTAPWVGGKQGLAGGACVHAFACMHAGWLAGPSECVRAMRIRLARAMS
jgi:hypothetical protein